jgi:hypothetical protein
MIHFPVVVCTNSPAHYGAYDWAAKERVVHGVAATKKRVVHYSFRCRRNGATITACVCGDAHRASLEGTHAHARGHKPGSG